MSGHHFDTDLIYDTNEEGELVESEIRASPVSVKDIISSGTTFEPFEEQGDLIPLEIDMKITCTL